MLRYLRLGLMLLAIVLIKRNEDGCTVHEYGSHIFHTNDKEVWDFLNRYTKFNDYQHRVRGEHQGRIIEHLHSVKRQNKNSDVICHLKRYKSCCSVIIPNVIGAYHGRNYPRV